LFLNDPQAPYKI